MRPTLMGSTACSISSSPESERSESRYHAAALLIPIMWQLPGEHGGGWRLSLTAPEQVWTVSGTVSIQEAALAAEATRKANCFVATNVPATRKSAEEVL